MDCFICSACCCASFEFIFCLSPAIIISALFKFSFTLSLILISAFSISLCFALIMSSTCCIWKIPLLLLLYSSTCKKFVISSYINVEISSFTNTYLFYLADCIIISVSSLSGVVVITLITISYY